MTNTADTSAAPSLLDQVRAAMPELSWDVSRYSTREQVDAHGLPRRRWISVSQTADGSYCVVARRWVRETPAAAGPDVDRLSTSRGWTGPDLAGLLAEAVADPLDAVTVVGVVLWADSWMGRGDRYTDDSGRYTFERAGDVWCWTVNHPATAKLVQSVVFGSGVGGQAATLPEAVADALDAPRRLAALAEALAAELAREAPTTEPWTYAAVIVAQDGEKAFVGPSRDLLDLKDILRQAERPFIGRMDTDASHIVAVPAAQAEGLDAAALIDHPAAVRLNRY